MGLPEAVYKGDSSDYLTLRTVDAALLGPGLSTGDNAVAELKRLLGAVFIPMVLDADALNIMSLHDDVALLVRNYPAPKILTPHVGEMGRLLHRTTAQVKADMVAIAKEAARIYGAVVVLKDASTVITDGNTVRICDAGSDGAGCGGSGDVLSGIIAGLLAGGCSAFDAAVMGVYIHDRAGFIASEKRGPRFMLSRDIIDCMKEVLR